MLDSKAKQRNGIWDACAHLLATCPQKHRGGRSLWNKTVHISQNFKSMDFNFIEVITLDLIVCEGFCFSLKQALRIRFFYPIE